MTNSQHLPTESKGFSAELFLGTHRKKFKKPKQNTEHFSHAQQSQHWSLQYTGNYV